MLTTRESELPPEGLFHCPLCFGQMDIAWGHYPDSLILPTATCPKCNFSVPTKILADETLEYRFYCHKVRELIGQIIAGELARQILMAHATFPDGKARVFISLMQREVPSAIEIRDDKPFFPLSGEDIALVKKVLNL